MVNVKRQPLLQTEEFLQQTIKAIDTNLTTDRLWKATYKDLAYLQAVLHKWAELSSEQLEHRQKAASRPIEEYFGLEINFMTPRETADFATAYDEYQEMFVHIIQDSLRHSEHHPSAVMTAMAGLVAEGIALKSTPLLTEESFHAVLDDMKELHSGSVN